MDIQQETSPSGRFEITGQTSATSEDIRDYIDSAHIRLGSLSPRDPDYPAENEFWMNHIRMWEAEIARPPSHGPIAATQQIGNGGGDWATRVICRLETRLIDPETRAVTSGNIDVPSVIDPGVVPLPENRRRVVDLLVNRRQIPGNEYEYLRQTVRTNNAAPVADSGTKPVSTYTMAPVSDRLRVVAHLSEPVFNRLLEDHAELNFFLTNEMQQGIVSALENQVVNGDGLGENFQGLLTLPGRTTVPFAMDVPTTLRKARTALEALEETTANAWVLNPTDVEALDLLRADGATGSYLVNEGFNNVFGNIPKLVTNSIPAGVAILADWSFATVYYRTDITLDVNTSGVSAGGANLFTTNQTEFRAEIRANVAYRRPSAFAVIDLTAA